MKAIYPFMSMKTFALTLLLIVLSRNLSAQDPGWFAQNSGTTEWLESVYFTDSMNGWVVGWDGIILHTSNGGLEWELQESGTTRDLRSVHFVDSMTGWIVGYRTILHTNNGGIEWEEQTSDLPFGTTLSGVYFINPLVGWAVGYDGDDGVAIRTTDGGQTWLTSSDGPEHPVFAITFTDEMTGYAAGGILTSGRIYQTVDGGDTFFGIGTTNWRLWDIHFSDGNHGRAVGHNGVTRFTDDGGQSWSNSSIGSMELFGVYVLNDSTIWACGGGGLVRHYNGSLPWSTQSTEVTAQMNSIFFVDEHTGWAVGSNGTIIHYTADGEPWTSVSENFIGNPDVTVYPNPFTDEARIQVDLATASNVSIELIEPTGKVIKHMLYSGLRESGSHFFQLDGNLLNDGVYFIRVQTDEHMETIRLIHVN